MKVPPDIRAFLDMWCADIVRHDVKAIMEHFSDRFLLLAETKHIGNNITGKDPQSQIQKGVISYEPTVMVLRARGDKSYVAGFFSQS